MNCLSSIQKPLHSQKTAKINRQDNNCTKSFHYTTIADRLRTVSLSKTATKLLRLNRLTLFQTCLQLQKLCKKEWKKSSDNNTIYINNEKIQFNTELYTWDTNPSSVHKNDEDIKPYIKPIFLNPSAIVVISMFSVMFCMLSTCFVDVSVSVRAFGIVLSQISSFFSCPWSVTISSSHEILV